MPAARTVSTVRALPVLLLAWGGLVGCGDRYLAAILPVPSAPSSGVPVEPPPDTCAAVQAPGVLLPTPPLGWNGWHRFNCRPEFDQAKVLANIDALVSTGLREAGYQYVNLDECALSAERAADGTLLATPSRFPDGLAAIGDYAHARGLKFGVEIKSGPCSWPEQATPGAVGHEAKDAASFVSWGVDYLKYGLCGDTGVPAPEVFETMRAALGAAGRPIPLSVVAQPFREWQRDVGQLWRTTGDVQPSWDSILATLDVTSPLAAYAGPGRFNDPDMLQIGNGSLTLAESRAYFSVWAALAAPLLAGNDLTEMSPDILNILGNTEMIEVNQDPLALQAALISTQGDVQVYAKPLASCGARAVVFLNRGDQPASGSVSLPELGLAPGPAQLRDLWAHAELPQVTDSLSVVVPARDVVALRVTGVEPALPRGEVYLSDLQWTYAVSGYGPVELDTSSGVNGLGDGLPLTLRGAVYAKGLGAHAASLVRYRLGKACREFRADIGIDDETAGAGAVAFEVWADGEQLFDSGTLLGTSPVQRVNVDVSGRSELRLMVGFVDDYTMDHADWADARLVCDDL